MKKKRKKLSGFAVMEEGQHKIIASMGGKAQGWKVNSGNFKNNPRRARECGRIGGMNQGFYNNPGNFANDPKRAAEAGRKGSKR